MGAIPVRGTPVGRRRFPVRPTAAAARWCHDGPVSRSVLVVDDDPDFRRLATRVLTSWGHTVTGEAGGVADALAEAARTRPDVALVDIGLPDGDGFELTTRLRSMPSPPQVVLISSDSSATNAATAHRVGARGFVAKIDLSEDRLRRLVEPDWRA
jgi:CheY-like chemotaxis protein